MRQEGFFSEVNMTKSDRSLHTPSVFSKQNLLYVQEVGRLKSLTPHKCVRENIDSFLIMLVVSGKGNLEVEGNNYVLSQGDCAFIDCVKHYEHISDAENAWELAWIHFNGNMARAYYDLFGKYNGKDVFRVQDISAWNDIIGELLQKQKEKSLIAELTSGEMILHLLNKVIECVSDETVSEGEGLRKIANHIREYLNENYSNENIQNEICQIFEQESTKVNDIFLKYFGISIDEYISNRRLNAAKELLRFTIKPIKEIAREAGISDVETMQELFRRQEGVSAEEYRAKWAQWIKS